MLSLPGLILVAVLTLYPYTSVAAQIPNHPDRPPVWDSQFVTCAWHDIDTGVRSECWQPGGPLFSVRCDWWLRDEPIVGFSPWYASCVQPISGALIHYGCLVDIYAEQAWWRCENLSAGIVWYGGF